MHTLVAWFKVNATLQHLAMKCRAFPMNIVNISRLALKLPLALARVSIAVLKQHGQRARRGGARL